MSQAAMTDLSLWATVNSDDNKNGSWILQWKGGEINNDVII